MDNLTHTLAGVAISYAGLNRKTRYATAALVIGANLPDIDLVSRFWGSATYLKYHRGITHSILGATLLAALLAAAFYFLGKRSSRPESIPALNGRWLFIACWVATLSHVLLDFTTSYGIRLFLPFDYHWYAWDIEPIIDPLLWTVLIAGLGLPFLFRLVSEEVGSARTGYQRGAVFSLCAMVALWGVRDLAHRRALNMLEARTYQGGEIEQASAFPRPANPFEWKAVVETPSAYDVLPVDVLHGNVETQDARVFRKPEPSPPLEAAVKTRTASIFMDFARFPWAEVIPTESGPTVLIRDLRYQPTDFERRAFVVRIQFDKELHVRSQAFSFRGRFEGR